MLQVGVSDEHVKKDSVVFAFSGGAMIVVQISFSSVVLFQQDESVYLVLNEVWYDSIPRQCNLSVSADFQHIHYLAVSRGHVLCEDGV
jgi:hypothetical protein